MDFFDIQSILKAEFNDSGGNNYPRKIINSGGKINCVSFKNYKTNLKGII